MSDCSLKASLPLISPIFGLTVSALYERQRELVRLGVLPAAKIGKGNGQRASADAVAMLAAAVMMTDNPSDLRRLAPSAIRKLGAEVRDAMGRGEAVIYQRPGTSGIFVTAGLLGDATAQLHKIAKEGS